jgi:hypothetical protein
MFPQYFVVIILFIPAIADQRPFWIEDDSPPNSPNLLNTVVNEDDDFAAAFAGITTFAHLPFINCLQPTYPDEATEKFDIAIVGAPFDTSVTYRPGYALHKSTDIVPDSDRQGFDWGVVEYPRDSIQIVRQGLML